MTAQRTSTDAFDWIETGPIEGLDETGFARPECLLLTASGDMFASDRRGGILHRKPDGRSRFIRARGNDLPDQFLPNGFALCPDRSFLIANLGPDGGVYHMTPDGWVSPRLLEVDGRQLAPTNFVNRDAAGGLWVSVSTPQIPRDLAFFREIADGYVVYADDRGAHVAIDDIGFSNENKQLGEYIYVNETIARRLSRYRVLGAGQVGPRETVTEFGDGIFPDGLDFDEEGGIWIASVVSNRLVRIAPDGAQQVVVDDSKPDAVAAAEAAYVEGKFARPHIDAGKHGVLGNLASVAFGGTDRRTLYLGSLFSDRIPTLPATVTGVAPPHWSF